MDDALNGDDHACSGIAEPGFPCTGLEMKFSGESRCFPERIAPPHPAARSSWNLRPSMRAHASAAGVPAGGSPYPLTLITAGFRTSAFTSTFGGLAVNDGTPVLEMHPADRLRAGCGWIAGESLE